MGLSCARLFLISLMPKSMALALNWGVKSSTRKIKVIEYQRGNHDGRGRSRRGLANPTDLSCLWSSLREWFSLLFLLPSWNLVDLFPRPHRQSSHCTLCSNLWGSILLYLSLYTTYSLSLSTNTSRILVVNVLAYSWHLSCCILYVSSSVLCIFNNLYA